MDSMPLPFSTTNDTPSSSSAATGSLLIRAPLTLDSDSEFDSGSSLNSFDNNSGLESEGEEFLSEEESESESESESETASERRDEEQENGIGHTYKVYVANKDNGDDVNSLENSVEEDLDESGDDSGLVDSSNSRPVVPIAQLSMNDEELTDMRSDEEIVAELEDGGYSGLIKVAGVVESSPRINVVLAVGEAEKEEDSLELISSAFVKAEAGNGGLQDFIVEYKSPGLELSTNDELVDSELDGDVKHSAVERIAPENLDDRKIESKTDELVEISGVDEDVKHSTIEEIALETLDDRKIESKNDALVEISEFNDVKHSDTEGIALENLDDSKIDESKNGDGYEVEEKSYVTGNDANYAPQSVVLSDEEKIKFEKLQLIRVKFLRLVQRLGVSPYDPMVAHVLYRLALSFGRLSSQEFTLESAKKAALQLEMEGKDDLDFSLNIVVLGKTGVGKSASINSIFCEQKSRVDAFEPGTNSVKEIVGTVDGVNIKIFDTPGLRSPISEEAANRRILASIKRFVKKFPPDVVLYIDRLDTHDKDHTEMLLMKSISDSLGSSIWKNAIVTLTHAAYAAPDGISYEEFVAQRSYVIYQVISQAIRDVRLVNPSMINPVALVENHASSQRDGSGASLLPNGQSWRSQLLLLCYSVKILTEANSLSKHSFNHQKRFSFRHLSLPLPYMLSSLLQSRPHPKLPTDHLSEDVELDVEWGDLTNSDEEDNSDEYDKLPPFKPLKRSHIDKPSKELRKAYFEEYDYRVKLLKKKQWREEVRRLRELKKKEKAGDYNQGYVGDDRDVEEGDPATVPVPLPDLVLPPSFDGDNPTYRYRFLDSASQLLIRPVFDSKVWDHDVGYDGVSLERSLAIAGRFPGAFAVQITKDKKELIIHLDSSVCAKHGEKGSTMAGFEIQTLIKQLAYTLRGETKFRNLTKNQTTAGLSATFIGDNVAAGLKIEDQVAVGKRLVVAGSAGAMKSQGETAYGANMEIQVKDKDFPVEQNQTRLGLSLLKWRYDLGLMLDLQSQFCIGRNSSMAVRAGMNNKQNGQISFKVSSSEPLHILAVASILPIAGYIWRMIYAGSNHFDYRRDLD